MAPFRFEVRRSRLHMLLQVAFAVALFVLLVTHGINLSEEEGRLSPLLTTALIAIIIGYYVWQSFQHFLDRTPQLVVGPEGLFLPAALDQPIPWNRIWRIDQPRFMLTGGQIALEIDPQIFMQMRLGQRFLGGNVVKRGGSMNSFSILPQGYDHGTDAILTAIKRYWPPAETEDDDDDED